MGMALFGSRDNLALQITQRGKERDGAVADIIMGLGASVTLLQRKGALCALQSLALTLLVATEQQSPLGRIQIEPDDVPEFLLKVRIIGDLKSLQPMWLYFVMAPNPHQFHQQSARAKTENGNSPITFSRHRPID